MFRGDEKLDTPPFLVLATDGIWDEATANTVVDEVRAFPLPRKRRDKSWLPEIWHADRSTHRSHVPLPTHAPSFVFFDRATRAEPFPPAIDVDGTEMSSLLVLASLGTV